MTMSRSGYSDDCDSNYIYLYRGMVERTLAGKRGQAFLKELATAMDAMPTKRLIARELVRADGEMCTIGVVCKSRGLDVTDVDVEDADAVGDLVNIARSMAAEIEYENDECGERDETPEQRWTRMRNWVRKQISAGGD
jgi:hypothetical protein